MSLSAPQVTDAVDAYLSLLPAAGVSLAGSSRISMIALAQ
jgi:hypothetical protein